jgi:DNA-binding transcriptional LysR family regulator
LLHEAFRMYACIYATRSGKLAKPLCNGAHRVEPLRTSPEMDINWDNLRVFLAVARSRSALESAAALKLDHSTITRRLKKLESKLESDIGSQLFDRSPQGHVLTPIGQRLLGSVEEIERTLARVDSKIGGDNQVLTGHVRLGATEGFGSAFLAPHLADFCARHPSIEVDLLAVPRFVNLSKREADLAVSIERPRAGSFVVCKLSDYRLAVYGTREYLRQHPPIRRPTDLAAHRFIGYVDELAFSAELRYLQKITPGARVALRSTSIVAQMQAVRRGHALGVLPCFLAAGHDDLERVLSDEASVVRTFWMYAPKAQREIARVRALWDYLRDAAREKQDFLLGVEG